MGRSVRVMAICSPILLGVMLACSRSPSTALPDKPQDTQPAQSKAPTRLTEVSPPVKPMRIGGEVSTPEPTTRLNVQWPWDRTQCYELGVAVFEGMVDRNGKPRDIKVIRGPDNEFTQAAREAIAQQRFAPAREAIAQQRFAPAMYRGKPVDVMYHVSINHFPMKKVQGPC